MGSNDQYDCNHCNDVGLVLLSDDTDTAFGVCPDCDRGNRLHNVLRAIARGEPIMLEHAIDHAKSFDDQPNSMKGSRRAHRIEPIPEG